jgi:hypothetical protein
VVAWNRVPRRVQAGQLAPDNAKLLRRAIIGIVSRQINEVDLSGGIAVHLIDDAAQIEMVVQAYIGDVEVSDL